ncbi:MAG: glycoside hydrolase family 2 TIM barrel-domain containing protein [Balneolaceae bacterium]
MSVKKLVYLSLSLFVILVLAGFISLRNLYQPPADEARTVYIKKIGKGYQLIRNGEPFRIQGAGGDTYFKELAEIGGNTIRVFSSSNLKDKLDEAHRHGLAVIVDIYIPKYNTLNDIFDGKGERLKIQNDIRELVDEHRDHPALLIWNLGNEIYYPVVFRKNEFIRSFNELVSMIQEVDPNHPVSTSIIGASRKVMSSIFTHSPQLDLVGFNTFGNTTRVNSHVAQVANVFGPRPYFISELGPDGPWEAITTSWGAPIEPTSSVKSIHYSSRNQMVKGGEGSASLGSILFYWGSKLERTHTWFSLFRDGDKSEIVNVIEALWKESDNAPEIVGLDYMLLNNKGARDNIILSPGEAGHAEVFFYDHVNDNLRIEWEIYPEDWYGGNGEFVSNSYSPMDTFIRSDHNKTLFRTPTKEGPYRIFAYVYNHDGTFATTNTPFYVLNHQ